MGSSSSKQLPEQILPSPGIAVFDGQQANGRTLLTFKGTFRPHMNKVTVSRGGQKLYFIKDQFIGIDRQSYRRRDIIDARSGQKIASVGVDLALTVSNCTCYVAKSKTPLFTLGRGENEKEYRAVASHPLESAVGPRAVIKTSFDGGVIRCKGFRVGQVTKKGWVVEDGMDMLLLAIMKVMMSLVRKLEFGTWAMTHATPGGGAKGRALEYGVSKLREDKYRRRMSEDDNDPDYGWRGTGMTKTDARTVVGREAGGMAQTQARKHMNKHQIGRVDSGYGSGDGDSGYASVPMTKKQLNAKAKASVKAELKARAKSEMKSQARGRFGGGRKQRR